MPNISSTFSYRGHRVLAIAALTGLFCSTLAGSAQAEEYWRGRNHPQPRQIIQPQHGWCERDWRPAHHHHYRHHYGHHYPRYTRIIVQPPLYHHAPVIIYRPHHYR